MCTHLLGEKMTGQFFGYISLRVSLKEYKALLKLILCIDILVLDSSFLNQISQSASVKTFNR